MVSDQKEKRLSRARQRAMASQVARELLPLMGIQQEMVHADVAFRVLDALFYTQPQVLPIGGGSQQVNIRWTCL